MTVKINNITVEGLRGVKSKLELPLNGKSILLYGDNGTGKSSISDVLEWFYTERVTHLSSSEIDLKEALVNSFLGTNDKSQVTVEFNKTALNSAKSIEDKNGKLVSQNSNGTDDFKNYLKQSEGENLLLRYQFLRDFVDQTKGDKLKFLSDIIGFSKVTKTKEVLGKSHRALKTELKNQNYESQISTQKQVLIEKLGASVTEEEQLFESINSLLKPLKLGKEVKSKDDIEPILKILKESIDKKVLNELKLLEDVTTQFKTLKSEVDSIDSQYQEYFDEFDKIAKDVEAIKQTFLGDLLKSAQIVVTKKYHKVDSCPVCLSDKNHDTLLAELKDRLSEIEEASKKKLAFDRSKKQIIATITERIKRVGTLLSSKELENDVNKELNISLTAINYRLETYLTAGNTKVTSGKDIDQPNNIKLTDKDFDFLTKVEDRHKAIQENLKKNNRAEVFAKIDSSVDAFKKIKNFEKERTKLEKQRKTLELVYNKFVAEQKKGLEDFINSFSGKINEYYQFMNPGEPFQEIKIVTIGEDDELNGLTIEYKYNDVWVSPPQKYFSESHLNCFGISFFLASVDAFNNTNKFLILDDVISSFDSSHRKRFAELIFEKFSQHQVMLLTHEWSWFENMVKPLAKKKGWHIKEIKWTDTKGTHFDETPSELKEFIEHNITEGNIKNLGNPLRRYLEGMLKNIAINIDAKMSFRYNDSNEHRMPNELLQGIRSEIKKCSPELKVKFPIFDRIESSSILGNICSHDNPFNPSLGDLKAFWADIHELNDVFSCADSDCRRTQVSLRNYDTVTKKIRCGCDKTKYDWKLN